MRALRRSQIRWIVSVALTAASQLASAETLKVAAPDIPPSLGNPLTATALPATELWSALFDGLTRLDWVGGAQPGLAVSWQNPTPNTWRFDIRDGASYHNGRPVTAESVAQAFTLLRDPSSAAFLVTRELTNITAVHTIDDDTIEFVLSEPDAILPKRLAVVMMVEPTTWQEVGADGFALAPVGSGPYRLDRWATGNTVAHLVAHEGSWRSPTAFNAMEYRAVSDKTSRIQGLLARQVDVATGLGVGDIADIEGAGFKAPVTPTTQIKSIALPNVKSGDHPFKDVRVRQALNHAVDKQAIADLIQDGRADVASQGAVPGIPGYNPALKPYAYDPDKARALLAQAEYPRGFEMTIEFVSDLTPLDPLIYQKVAQDLGVIGVVATVRLIPFSDYVRKYTANAWGDVDAFSLLWNNASYQDAIRPFEYFSCLRINPFFCDEDTAAMVTAVQRQTSPKDRTRQMQAIMARLHELAPAIWLTNSVYVNATRPDINGFRMAPTGTVFEELAMEPK